MQPDVSPASDTTALLPSKSDHLPEVLSAWSVAEPRATTGEPVPETNMWSVGVSSSPAVVAAIRDVQQLVHLPPNWDTYGGRTIQEPAIRGASYLVRVGEFLALPLPHVVPTSNGGVQLEWDTGNRALELEVDPDGVVRYLQVEGECMWEGTASAYHGGEVRKLMRWFVDGDAAGR